MTTTYLDIVKEDATYVCDGCKKPIHSRDLVLSTPMDNLVFLYPPTELFVYINKEGILMQGQEQPKSTDGKKILACPYCKKQHIFGFDKYE